MFHYLSWNKLSQTKRHKQADTNFQLIFELSFVPCVAIKNHLFVGFWLAVEISQPINSRVLGCNAVSKTEHTIWKSIKNWAENWCQIVCGILFDLIYCITSSETVLFVKELKNYEYDILRNFHQT